MRGHWFRRHCAVLGFEGTPGRSDCATLVVRCQLSVGGRCCSLRGCASSLRRHVAGEGRPALVRSDRAKQVSRRPARDACAAMNAGPVCRMRAVGRSDARVGSVGLLDLAPGAWSIIVGMDDEKAPMLSIGEFAARTRLTRKALRIYDRNGLLEPAEVDEWTGYRRYVLQQVPVGRLVGLLRAADLSLKAIESVIAELPDTDRRVRSTGSPA